MRDIGKNIKQLRQSKNMTQDDLAEKLFVTRQTVSNYETGKSRPDIDMLARIAQTLDTDPNTVLYGTAQQESRTRMWQTLWISLAVLVAAWIGFIHLANLGKELAQTHYEMTLSLLCNVLGVPVVAFLFGWTATQALGTFAKLSPLSNPWGRRLRWITLGSAVGYLLLMVPFFATFILESNLGTFLPDLLWNPWSSAAMWLSGYVYGMVLKPNLLLFVILGCTLWLGIPQRIKQ